MSKIQDYVSQHNVKPSDCLYHTQRTAKNAKGEPTGRIRVLVPKETGMALVEYTCPECGHADFTEQEWKRPFYLRCAKCNAKVSVPKMRDEAKRETKKGK
ncbi:MAG: hypothetical protein HYY37_00145 [Candidatus Aenigmarchaeota archaeon]|nr:hypothetical protein [Candidatus Aenigmarchaeota archaeon]